LVSVLKGKGCRSEGGIAAQALQAAPLSHFSVDERMSWAATRQTKRGEDAAYSLLGIFDINIPLIYGEGRKKALSRLEREIKESLKGKSPSPAPVLFLKYGDLSKYQGCMGRSLLRLLTLTVQLMTLLRQCH
jgi:hypothetical protein